MDYLNLLIVFALGGAGFAFIGFIFCLCLNKYRKQVSRTYLHEREVLGNIIDLGKEDIQKKQTVITCPVILDNVNAESFSFRVFSSERPKTLASKSKDTVDPALEYSFPKEFHCSAVISQTDNKLMLFCFGGQDKENPQTNYNQSIMILRSGCFFLCDFLLTNFVDVDFWIFAAFD